MKKLIVVLVLTMTFAMAACSGKNDNKSSENKVKTDRVEFKSAFSEKKVEPKTEQGESKGDSFENKEEETEHGEFAGEGVVIFAMPQKDDEDTPTRSIQFYTYKDNSVLRLEKYASVRYQPEGTEITELDKKTAKELFVDKYAKEMGKVRGVDISTKLGDERYEQRTIYDYTVLDFDEFFKVRKELGIDSSDDEADKSEFLVMDEIAKGLLKKGYTKIKENDFKGSGRKTYVTENLLCEFEYKDNEVTKATIVEEAKYANDSYAAKKALQEMIDKIVSESPKFNGKTVSAEYGDDSAKLKFTWDFVEGDFDEFLEKDTDFRLEETAKYMSNLVASCISLGFVER